MKIIANAKRRTLECGVIYEEHHILPRSLYPNWVKRKSNIVKLTLREHYFCHQLLEKIYPCKQMAFALWQMSMKYKSSGSREYERAKKIYREYAVEFWNRPEIRLRSREQQISIWQNKELLKRHSDLMKEIMNRPDVAEKRNAGVRKARQTPVMCIETGQVFENLYSAANWCNLKSYAKIGECARGERLHAGKHPDTKVALTWQYVGHVNIKKAKEPKVRSKCNDLLESK